jgi:tRNA pseudouridine55 synthase
MKIPERGYLNRPVHRMNRTLIHGLLVLDKPAGVTSRNVVDRAQRWFPPGTRVGHTGTLDPLATGVLVLCIGVATRLAEYVQRMEKTYRAGLLLGARSTTDDADGEIEVVAVEQPPERARVAACLQEFVGEIEQVPPGYSAAKVAGRRAYDLARWSRTVSLKPRRVRIHAIDVLDYEYPRLELLVRCGKGTYIRALARDSGKRLGCGALVEKLRRTCVGPFDAAHVLALEADTATARASLLPLSAAVAELPRVTLRAEDVQRLRQGQLVSIPDFSIETGFSPAAYEVAVFDEATSLVAVAVVERDSRRLRPEKVFPTGA